MDFGSVKAGTLSTLQVRIYNSGESLLTDTKSKVRSHLFFFLLLLAPYFPQGNTLIRAVTWSWLCENSEPSGSNSQLTATTPVFNVYEEERIPVRTSAFGTFILRPNGLAAGSKPVVFTDSWTSNACE